MATFILDIEGTVCPISFVHGTLFPYFIKKVPEYLDSVEYPIKPTGGLSSTLLGFPDNVTQDKEALLEYIESLVYGDIKDVTLKALQGIVWKEGYEKGEIKAPVYPDAIELIASGRRIYIYSSGSVDAQILLFKHVDIGGQLKDLTPYISGYFDISTAGHKQEKASYEKIAREIGQDPKNLTFYSDVAGEIDAAKAAGLNAVVVLRIGNLPIAEPEKYNIITSFSLGPQ